jgi:hypothetical protein
MENRASDRPGRPEKESVLAQEGVEPEGDAELHFHDDLLSLDD